MATDQGQQEQAGAPVDIKQVLDAGPVGLADSVLLTLGLLGLISDGYDIGVAGAAVPELVRAWHLPSAAVLTLAQAAAPIGLLIGAPLLGAFGDRRGRRPAVLTALALVSLFTLAAAASTNAMMLAALRFVAGLGLGGLVPNIYALALETAPKRRRALFVMVVSLGFGVGVALASGISGAVISHFGWQGLFLLGSALPLLTLMLAWRFTGESVIFLAARRNAEPNCGVGCGSCARTRPYRTMRSSPQRRARDRGAVRCVLFLANRFASLPRSFG